MSLWAALTQALLPPSLARMTFSGTSPGPAAVDEIMMPQHDSKCQHSQMRLRLLGLSITKVSMMVALY